MRKFLFAESKAEREKGRGQKDQLKIRDIRNALSGVTEGTTLEKTPSYILKGFWEQEDALAKMHQGGPIKQSGKYELLAGEMVMDNLKGLDRVAYIRFASVYRDFRDIETFKDEINALLEPRQAPVVTPRDQPFLPGMEDEPKVTPPRRRRHNRKEPKPRNSK